MMRRARRLTLAVLLGSMAAAAPAFAADTIYWDNYNGTTISHANLDGSGGGVDLAMTGATVNNPYGIAIDAAAGKVYWPNFSGNNISVANLDGTGAHDLTITGVTVQGPSGIAINPAAGKIYWANSGDNTIDSANLDGSGAVSLNTTGVTVSSPDGVAIDPAVNRIYWANGDTTHPVQFANLDGTGGAGNLDVTGTTSPSPIGVAIDPANGRIYWGNQNDGINFANLDDSGAGGALNTTGVTVTSPQAVAVDPVAGRVYWADFAGQISFANADNSGGGGSIDTTGATPDGPVYPALLRAPSAAGLPLVTGGHGVGSSLSCSTGTWGADFLGSFLYRAPQSFSYSWTLNGAPLGGTGSTLTPTSVGSYACTVTATNFAGSASQTSAAVAVALTPTATISSPAGGRTYRRGQSVLTTFTCVEGIGGPGLASCTDSRAASGPHGSLSTGTLGKHTYTVTAVSKDGLSSRATITYHVVAVAIKSGRATVKHGKAKLKLACSGARGSVCGGTLKLTVRAKVNGHNRAVVLGSARIRVAAGKTRKVAVKLTAAGRTRLAGASNGSLRCTATVLINGGRATARSVTLLLA